MYLRAIAYISYTVDSEQGERWGEDEGRASPSPCVIPVREDIVGMNLLEVRKHRNMTDNALVNIY